jgi:acyl carrier protein
MEELEGQLKRLIVSALDLQDIKPEEISSDEPLFGAGLGLDSIDGLELGIALSRTYGVKIEKLDPRIRLIFSNVRSLAAYIISEGKAR